MIFGAQGGDRTCGLGHAVDLQESATEDSHGIDQDPIGDWRGAI
jgi:hypothetical protein